VNVKKHNRGMATYSRAHGLLRNRNFTRMSSGTRRDPGAVVPHTTARSDAERGKAASTRNKVACAGACLYHQLFCESDGPCGAGIAVGDAGGGRGEHSSCQDSDGMCAGQLICDISLRPAPLFVCWADASTDCLRLCQRHRHR